MVPGAGGAPGNPVPEVFPSSPGARRKTPWRWSRRWSSAPPPAPSRGHKRPGLGHVPVAAAGLSCQGATGGRRPSVTAPLRAIKDEAEVEALAKAAAAADRVAAALLGGEIASGRPDRARGLGGNNPPPSGRRQRKGQFRHRRFRAQFGQPSSRAGRAHHRTGRSPWCVTLVARWRLLLGHHQDGFHRPPSREHGQCTGSWPRPRRRA